MNKEDEAKASPKDHYKAAIACAVLALVALYGAVYTWNYKGTLAQKNLLDRDSAMSLDGFVITCLIGMGVFGVFSVRQVMAAQRKKKRDPLGIRDDG